MSNNFDHEKLLNLYIHDYMLRRNIPQVADTFSREANFRPELMASDSEEGFLREWWYIFWDIFCPRHPRLTVHLQTQELPNIQAPEAFAAELTQFGQNSPEFQTPPSFGPTPPQHPSTPPTTLNTSNGEFDGMLESLFQGTSILNPQNSDLREMPDLLTPMIPTTNAPMTVLPTPRFSGGVTTDNQTIRMMPTPRLPTGTAMDSHCLMPNPNMSASMTDTQTDTNRQTLAQPYVPSIAHLEEMYGPMSTLLKATCEQEMTRRDVRARAREVDTNSRNLQVHSINQNPNHNMASSSRGISRMPSSSMAGPSSRSPKNLISSSSGTRAECDQVDEPRDDDMLLQEGRGDEETNDEHVK